MEPMQVSRLLGLYSFSRTQIPRTAGIFPATTFCKAIREPCMEDRYIDRTGYWPVILSCFVGIYHCHCLCRDIVSRFTDLDTYLSQTMFVVFSRALGGGASRGNGRKQGIGVMSGKIRLQYTGIKKKRCPPEKKAGTSQFYRKPGSTSLTLQSSSRSSS